MEWRILLDYVHGTVMDAACPREGHEDELIYLFQLCQLFSHRHTTRVLRQERDDLRKRTRQERLHCMRGGAPRCWVDLPR